MALGVVLVVLVVLVAVVLILVTPRGGTSPRSGKRNNMAVTTEIETTDNRPEAVAFAFGRVWYAGVESTRWSTTLCY